MGDSKTGEFARRGFEVMGVAAGGAAGLVTGDPSVGLVAATAGTFLGGVFGDMVARHISKVEARRLNTVAGEAARLIKANLAEGRSLRTDGFFDEDVNGRSRAHEIAEAAFVAAMRSHEEKKIPYIAHLLAEAAFASEVDAATLNWALVQAQDLTWTQYLLLAAVGSDEYDVPDDAYLVKGESWEKWGTQRQLTDLSRPRELAAAPTPSRGYGARLDNGGVLLYSLLGLELVDPVEIAAVLRTLTSP